MVASYFYVIPVTQISHVATTDFRLYDMVFIFGLIFLLPHFGQLRANIRSHKWLSRYMFFSLWCVVTVVFNLFLLGYSQAFIAAGRLGRFMAYGLVAAAILTFITKKEDLEKLVRFFFLLIALQALLSTLQSLGLVKQLWPDYWLQAGGQAGGYEDLPVGTLGLHHLHPGTLIVLGTSLGLGLLRYEKRLGVRLFITVSVVLMLYTSFIVVSRSAWLGLAIVVALFFLSLVKDPKKGAMLGAVFWLIVVIACLIWLGGEGVQENISDSWNKGFEDKVEADGLTNLSPSRVAMWLDFPNVVMKHPWILIQGAGIQNAGRVLNIGVAMHNNYLHVIVETGIIGFYLYVTMLLAIWRQSSLVVQAAEPGMGQAVIRGFRGAFAALLVLNFFNENFYMQYSSFSLTGQIMAFAALSLHPLWIPSSENKQLGVPSGDKKSH